MPTDHVQNKLFDSAAEALVGCNEWLIPFLEDLADVDVISVAELTTFHGNWALHLEIPGSEVNHHFYGVALNEDPGTLASPKQLLNTPGVAFTISSRNTDGSGGSAGIVAAFTDKIIPARNQLIASGFYATTEDAVLKQKVDPSGYINTAIWSTFIEMQSGFAVLVDSLRSPDDPTFTIWADDWTPEQPAPGVMVGGFPSIGPLVEAVNAITDQDFEIAFNDRKFVFSVKSKVMVGG